MNVQQTNDQRGFTIIEVVLVLAIAGLIFLMVFIALPALQKGQRDTQRRSDLGRISTQINSYTTNNRGAIPQGLTTNNFVQKYLGGTSGSNIGGNDYIDPKGPNYTFADATTDTQSPTFNDTTSQILYGRGKICGTDGDFATGSARQYALKIRLEGQTTPYCLDNR